MILGAKSKELKSHNMRFNANADMCNGSPSIDYLPVIIIFIIVNFIFIISMVIIIIITY